MSDHIDARVAACACGQLSVSCRGEPELVSLCSCLQCQRRTGSAFGLAAFFRRDAVMLQGSAATFIRKSDAGLDVDFYFCETCGSTVFWKPERKPNYVAVAVGCFAEPDFAAPSKYAHDEHRHPWLSFRATKSAAQ
jgi:hypothetical protein